MRVVLFFSFNLSRIVVFLEPDCQQSDLPNIKYKKLRSTVFEMLSILGTLGPVCFYLVLN